MTKKTASHGGNVYEFAQSRSIQPSDVLDFSANINPLGMSYQGYDAILSALKDCEQYPDIHNRELLLSLSSHLELPPEYILLGNGASELLYGALHALPIQTVYVPAPGFSEYTKASLAMKKSVCYYPIGGLGENCLLRTCDEAPLKGELGQNDSLHKRDELDNLHALGQEQTKWPIVSNHKGDVLQAYGVHEAGIEQIRLKIHESHSESIAANVLYIIGNPNNPDGSLVNIEAFEQYLQATERNGAYVLVDESFIEFTDESHSVRQFCRRYKHLLVLHSLTKFYAVPGLRLGVILGHPTVLDLINDLIPAWSVNRLAQVYGVAALHDRAYIEASKAYITEERQRIYRAYKDIPFLQVVEPTVNFMLLRWLPESPCLEDFIAYVNGHHMMLRNCQAYEGLGRGWFRIAIKKKEENNVLLSHVKEYGNEHNLFSSSWTD